ncbi:1-phosphofructokinase [Microbacterium sp. SLBN-146]|uniref:1-phosphofructokinase n=1 Tax=Microbacterium sp. SLBN-146 TaxID=2768457 RepID=UPI00114FD968|nr:1-phosphofructokinase [Microbacterium sp. SLBN-146]TQJ31887.1 1-phosphofructokinase [Microbacterium sp. SLBN-146]
MIITLTANPSLDRTIVLEDALRPGEVQSASEGREDAGGKGINVARVIAAAGADARAILPLADDDPFASALRAAGLRSEAVPIAGRARSNLTITDPAGTTTKLNLPGAELSREERSAIVRTVVEATAEARWLVLAGSLPPGAGDGFYVDVISAVRAAHGDRAPLVAVDTSGPALTAVVNDAAPDLIKPNDEELAELAGVAISDGDLAHAVLPVARELVPTKVRAALVTLGAAGAVLVTSAGAWSGRPPRIRVVSTVGAGDSSLAGYLLAEAAGGTPEDCLRSAIRYGAAAASLQGTQAPHPGDLPAGDVPVDRIL